MYVKFKGNFMEVKCFVICTDLLLPLKVNLSYFEIHIFMLLKLESESGEQLNLKIIQLKLMIKHF